MRRLRVVSAGLLAAALAAGLAACAERQQQVQATGGSAPFAVPTEARRVQASGTVLESPEHGPRLCYVVETSLPPQCGGIDLVGWDWAAVDGEESANGTTWGAYQVTGTWDGSRITVTEPPAPPSDSPVGTTDFSTPCPEPPGGWQVIDPSLTTDESLNDTAIAAKERPDFAGLWIDQPIRGTLTEATANDPTNLVLNVRVTGDVAAAERDLRQLWGGALCVTAAEFTEEELTAIQAEIGQDAQSIRMLASRVDTTTGTVEVTVAHDDGTLQATYDVRYGPGVVRVVSWLQPA